MKKTRPFQFLQYLSYLTQLGLSIAVPPVLCVLAAGWLQKRFGIGDWIMLCGIFLGIGAGASSFLSFIRYFRRQIRRESDEIDPTDRNDR